LLSALDSAGATAVYVEYPRTEHGFDLFLQGISPVARSALAYIERFVATAATDSF
jgi:acetyl esterase/lipase